MSSGAILSSILKDLYNPEPPACIRLYREGKLSETELILFSDEIEKYKNSKANLSDLVADLVYQDNPLMKRR